MNLTATQVFRTMGFWTALANATMFTTYAVYQVVALGLNPLQLLLVGMVLEVTVLIFEGVTGVIADLYGRRLSVIIGMFVLGCGFILEGSAIWLGNPHVSAFIWLLLSQVVFGIGATLISGADTAWIVDEVGEEQAGRVFLGAKRIGLWGTLIGIALSVGISSLGPNLPYVAGGVLYLALGLFLFAAMKETRFIRAERGNDTSHWANMKTTWLSGAQVIRRQPMLMMILVVTLFSGAASEGYDRLWQAHLIVDIGFPLGEQFTAAIWIGMISVISTLLSLPVMRIAENRIDMSDERIVLRGMIVLTAARIAAIAALAFAPGFDWALVSVLLIEIVRTLNGPFYDTWLNLNIDSKSRATVLSMMSQSDALGQTAGGPVVGWIGNRLSLRASLAAASVLLVPILSVYSRAARHKR
ncbi:MFS transporter [Paenibacillus thalictri]|uniref:MFS transporter n=2 Tax=Paenibacillus thalictri TaxID=2527873 RepID=A0A4Q9DQL9_9BACL|nr:MFS transporter [Paenibacillus thalictri]TBL78718.1 MFS transporter [Paenibacillus thalictri]